VSVRCVLNEKIGISLQFAYLISHIDWYITEI